MKPRQVTLNWQENTVPILKPSAVWRTWRGFEMPLHCGLSRSEWTPPCQGASSKCNQTTAVRSCCSAWRDERCHKRSANTQLLCFMCLFAAAILNSVLEADWQG